MLELLDQTGTDLSEEALRAAFLDLRTAHVIAACQMTALEICYSAREQADLEALLAGQWALEWLPVSEAAMDRALEVQRLLAAVKSAAVRHAVVLDVASRSSMIFCIVVVAPATRFRAGPSPGK